MGFGISSSHQGQSLRSQSAFGLELCQNFHHKLCLLHVLPDLPHRWIFLAVFLDFWGTSTPFRLVVLVHDSADYIPGLVSLKLQVCLCSSLPWLPQPHQVLRWHSPQVDGMHMLNKLSCRGVVHQV